MTERSWPVSILMLTVLLLVGNSVAQAPSPQEATGSSSLDLLDRGSSGTSDGPGMMATLAVGVATPGVTMVGVVFTPTMVPTALLGNFYTAPGDFPTSWYPFDVTGAFAWQTMAPAPPGDLILGVGVAPGPFTGGGGTMWGAFATAMFPLPAFMTPSLVGMPGIFPGAPTPALPVPTGAGVACGLEAAPLGPTGGPGLGGIAVTMGPRFLYTFGGPPLGPDFLTVQPYPALIHFVAGCFVSGATVPVELQSFHID